MATEELEENLYRFFTIHNILKNDFCAKPGCACGSFDTLTKLETPFFPPYECNKAAPLLKFQVKEDEILYNKPSDILETHRA